jgi:hypothetical protein
MARQAFVFSARLDGWKGVHRTIAVRADQTLAVLHDALRVAFDWDDDHLYAFWLSGKFWGRDDTEYVRPVALFKGQRIAYVFDFGDEWRVRLTLRDLVADDAGAYPRILESVGEAPPQYPDYEENAA